MATPQKPIKRRRKRTSGQSAANAPHPTLDQTTLPTSTHPDNGIDAVHLQASALLVDLFHENEADALNDKHRETLQKLVKCGVDLNPLIELVKDGTLTITLLEELLSKYRIINLRRLDGSVVKPPTTAELIVEANTLLLKDFSSLRFPHLLETQIQVLESLATEELSIIPIIKSIETAQDQTLALLTVAAAAANSDKQLTKQTLLNFLKLDKYTKSSSGSSANTNISFALQRAKDFGLKLTPQHIAECQKCFQQQQTEIAESRKQNASAGGLGRHYAGRLQGQASFTYTDTDIDTPKQRAGRQRSSKRTTRGNNDKAEKNKAQETPSKNVHKKAVKLVERLGLKSTFLLPFKQAVDSGLEKTARTYDHFKKLLINLLQLIWPLRLFRNIYDSTNHCLSAITNQFKRLRAACSEQVQNAFGALHKLFILISEGLKHLLTWTFSFFVSILRVPATIAHESHLKINALVSEIHQKTEKALGKTAQWFINASRWGTEKLREIQSHIKRVYVKIRSDIRARYRAMTKNQ